ncbi:MAG: hypothetical protein Q9159_005795 [Coniocarpon cinnabarinum]
MAKAFLFSSLILGAPTVNAFCNTFTVIPQNYTERGSTTTGLNNLTVAASYDYRVGPAIICNDTAAAASPNCPGGTCAPQLANGTVVDQTGVANVTLSPDDTASLFEMIASTAGIPFPVEACTTLGTPNAETYNTCISPTLVGYLTFTPLMNCVNGVLTDCSDSAVVDGTTVRACSPMTPQGQLSGAIFFRQTDDATANALGPVPNPAVPVM